MSESAVRHLLNVISDMVDAQNYWRGAVRGVSAELTMGVSRDRLLLLPPI